MPQDLLLGGGRQSADAWIAAHPSQEVWLDGPDARLLQHDFRNPDGVGIPLATPGEKTRMLRVPVKKQVGKQ
jgi:hypothetical protein